MGSLPDFFAAFHFFGTDIKQGNPRTVDPQRMAGQNIAHNGKLGQIDGITFGIGAQVEHNIFAVLMRHNADDCRTVNPLDGFQNQFGDSHQRTGISRRDNRFSLAAADSVYCHIHAGIAVADNLGRLVVVTDDFGGMPNLADFFKSG